MLCWLVGVGNMAGIPLMSGFVSKWMLYAAALQAGWAIPALIAWIASLGTVFVCAKATSAVFLGPQTDATRDAHEASPAMQWGMALMAIGSIVLGIAPQISIFWFFRPMLSAFGLDTSVRVTWLGIFAGAGTFSTAGGLLLAIVSLLLGTAIFALARTSGSVHVATVSAGSGGVLLGHPGDVFTGGEPLWEQDRLTAADFSRIFEQNWQSFFRWSNVDRVYAYALSELRALAGHVARPIEWLEKHVVSSLLIFSAMIFVAAGWMWQATGSASKTSPAAIPELLTAAACVAAVAVVTAASETVDDALLPLQVGFVSVLCIAGCMTASEWPRYGLLESAALLSVIPVWRKTQTRAARLAYLTIVLLSGLSLGLSSLLSSPGTLNWSRAFFLVGVCVKFAAIPFLFWLLRLADELPAAVLGLILAVIDMAAVGELLLRAQVDPALFAPSGTWLLIAVLTSLSAALLMLAQRSMKRLLVLSSIEDCGFLLLGISSLGSLGKEAVVLAAASHALAKSLLFVSIASPEHDGALARNDSGLVAHYPFSAFGFLLGMLAMLGVPPLLGFAGRWRLYEAALAISPALLAGFVIASMLALIAYVNVFAHFWWGAPSHEKQRLSAVAGSQWYLPPTRHEPVVLRAVIVLLFVCLLGAGLWPQIILQGFRGGHP